MNRSGMTKNHRYCTSADGKRSRTFTFENSKQGFDMLWSTVLVSKGALECNEVIVGYESNGPYEEPLLHYLKQKPVTIIQVNPLTRPVEDIKEGKESNGAQNHSDLCDAHSKDYVQGGLWIDD